MVRWCVTSTPSIMTEPLYVAMSANHPLAGREALRAADVSAWPWISTHAGFPLEGVLSAIAATAGRPLDVRHRINDFALAASVAAAGEVLALLPGHLTVADPRLVLRPLADLPAARHIDVLARPETLHRAAVRTVLDTLRDIIGAPGPRPPATR